MGSLMGRARGLPVTAGELTYEQEKGVPSLPKADKAALLAVVETGGISGLVFSGRGCRKSTVAAHTPIPPQSCRNQ